MLIDQLLGDPVLAKVGFISADLRGRLSKATKFVLRRDFAMAADEFSSDIDNVNKVLGFARLPYPECWFEVAQADRELFANSPEPLGPTDGRCQRVGFLLTQLDHAGSWSARLFWSFLPDENFAGFTLPPSTSRLVMHFDARARDAFEATAFSKAEGVRDLSGELPLSLLRLRSPPEDDWIGEPGYIIATLALLNSRNASEAVEVDLAKKNKRRKLVGKRLLFDYRMLCIPQRYKQRNVPAAGEDIAQLRAHFVRGHFKARKTGIFFWSAYQRGNPSLGFVHKDYVLAQPGAAA